MFQIDYILCIFLQSNVYQKSPTLVTLVYSNYVAGVLGTSLKPPVITVNISSFASYCVNDITNPLRAM